MTDVTSLVKAFDQFAYGQSKYLAFTELLDWALLPFKKFDTNDEQLSALDTFREHPKVTKLTTLISLIGGLSEGFNDPIGELYMQSISHGHDGQYFTPTPICEMMAIMNVGEKAKPSERVLDCACGSGRMLLATAKVNRALLLFGADLDLTCCKMALLNMVLNSLTGEIAHMDSLSNQFHRGFKTSTTIVGGHHIPFFVEFTDPEKSFIWLRPRPTKLISKFDKPFDPEKNRHSIQGIQGTLF